MNFTVSSPFNNVIYPLVCSYSPAVFISWGPYIFPKIFLSNILSAFVSCLVVFVASDLQVNMGHINALCGFDLVFREYGYYSL